MPTNWRSAVCSVQFLRARLVGQLEPVLDEVHPEQALQPDRRAAVACRRTVRLDHAAKRLAKKLALRQAISVRSSRI